ncbi:hypothetical protein BDZ45DRAFT_84414 [Acephala macrosclerotiorum]|nr:hypothetical protein BDZ45DRAFT_84414 [Acephala macrosclerotiorum]
MQCGTAGIGRPFDFSKFCATLIRRLDFVTAIVVNPSVHSAHRHLRPQTHYRSNLYATYQQKMLDPSSKLPHQRIAACLSGLLSAIFILSLRSTFYPSKLPQSLPCNEITNQHSLHKPAHLLKSLISLDGITKKAVAIIEDRALERLVPFLLPCLAQTDRSSSSHYKTAFHPLPLSSAL